MSFLGRMMEIGLPGRWKDKYSQQDLVDDAPGEDERESSCRYQGRNREMVVRCKIKDLNYVFLIQLADMDFPQIARCTDGYQRVTGELG